jgi:hypothetical protein
LFFAGHGTIRKQPRRWEIQTGSPQGPVEPVDYIKQRNAHTYLQEETVCGVKCGLEKNPDAKRVRRVKKIRMLNVYGTETWQQLEKQLRVIGTVIINVS